MGKWLTYDPGEDTGISAWEDQTWLGAYTVKMADVPFILHALMAPYSDKEECPQSGWEIWDAIDPEGSPGGGLDRVVCEDFRIYPWAAGGLSWDPVRTARLIGMLDFLCRLYDVPFVLQPAKIKERAIAGGAEEFFLSPLHENRHANDATMHGVYYIGTELRGGSNREKKPTQPAPTGKEFSSDKL